MNRLHLLALPFFTLVASLDAPRPLAGGEEEVVEPGSRSLAVLSFRTLHTFETRLAYLLAHTTGARKARRFTEWVAQFSGAVNRGVARDRPLGLILRGDGELLFFFPVEDRQRVRAAFEGVFPDREALGGTGVYRIDAAGPVFLRLRSRWCYLAIRELAILGPLPRPEAFIPEDALRFDVFLTVDIEGLATLRRPGGAPAIAGALPPGAWARSLAADLLGGGKRLELGLNLGEGLDGELSLSTRSKSSLASSVRDLLGQRSRFLLPEGPASVLDLRMTLPVPLFAPDERSGARAPAEAPSAGGASEPTGPGELRARLLRIAWKELKRRLEGEALDLALSVRADPHGDLELALGVFLPGAASLDTWLRGNLPLLEKLKVIRDFEPSRLEFGGVSLHAVRPPGLEGSPFGRDPRVLVGTGGDIVYVSIGDGSALIEEMIRGVKSPEREAAGGSGPMYLQVSIGPVLKALAQYTDLPLPDELGALLSSDPGRLRLRVESTPESVRLSCQIDEPALAPLVDLLGRFLDPTLLLGLGRAE